MMIKTINEKLFRIMCIIWILAFILLTIGACLTGCANTQYVISLPEQEELSYLRHEQ